MEKIDFKKELQHLYKPSAKDVVIVDVPAMNFLMVDGKGDPNTSEEFQDAMEALFTLSYALKFKIKNGKIAVDYSVMPLEGLWWHDDMTKFRVDRKDEWQWTMMIMQPEYVTKGLLSDAIIQVKMKKDPIALTKVRFESFPEGKAAQIMHVGPFSEEGPTIERLHDFILGNEYEFNGKHHEIYLSDLRKASSENWKTILRQPVK